MLVAAHNPLLRTGQANGKDGDRHWRTSTYRQVQTLSETHLKLSLHIFVLKMKCLLVVHTKNNAYISTLELMGAWNRMVIGMENQKIESVACLPIRVFLAAKYPDIAWNNLSDNVVQHVYNQLFYDRLAARIYKVKLAPLGW